MPARRPTSPARTPVRPGPLARLAARTRALAGGRRLGAAFLLGFAGALAHAPLHLFPLLALALTGLVWLLDGAGRRRDIFAIVWFFAWGHFIAGFYWTGISFFVDAGRFGWLVPLPVLGLPAGLALIPAATVSMARILYWRGAGRVLVLAIAWSLAEWLRGHLLTGFPWNLSAYIFAFSDTMMQPAALVGAYGLSLLTLMLAASPALLPERAAGGRGADALLVALTLLLLGWVGFGLARLAGAGNETVPGIGLRLVQASIPQNLKWVEEERARNLLRHLELSTGPGLDRINVWVWPESAVAYFVEREPARLELLRRLAGRERLLLTGTVRRSAPDEPLAIWNSLLAIGGDGVRAAYDKQHLVPFGEYLPLRGLLARVGLDKLTHGQVDFSAGTGSGLIEIEGLPAARVLICYEAIFPGEIARPGASRPGWLLNVTNDAWFGYSSGPFQHFAAARFRAVEQGLPLVRAANNGISAIVDAHGRVRGLLGLNEVGVLDGGLPRALDAPTPYARLGDAAYAALLVLGLFAAWLLSAARPRS